jgi:2-polyprenyl-3-methyl-5-hydroxy-6-metoxy-1,4-benzoquinol methylase
MQEKKDTNYYSCIRREILPLLPADCERILEIGCGKGNTLRWLKDERTDSKWLGGVDMFTHSDTQFLDYFRVGNIETLDLQLEPCSIDVILCLDVLEHLVDPWKTVANLQRYLKPGGSLIASIPNIRYFKASLPLLFLGRWRYEAEGILDITHLRFFTKESALALMQSSNLQLTGCIATGLERGRKAWWLNLATFGTCRPLLEFQYLIRVTNTNLSN